MMFSDSDLNAADRQALAWQARLSSDLIGDAERRDFEQWLRQSPEHEAAWRAVNDFWSGLDSVSLADLGLETLPARRSRRRWQVGLALAASLVLAAGLIAPRLDGYFADYRSATGEQRRIALEDGSTLLLNTASAVSVDYSKAQRRVVLHGGEAYFSVAANPKQPFVVSTALGDVQALGTAFDVKYEDESIEVTVFEHAVEISLPNGAAHTRLREGESLRWARGRIGQFGRANLYQAGAWRRQRMVFQDQALAAVVAELDRYRPGKILVIGSAIEKLPITGVFDTNDTDVALTSIEQSLPVKIRKLPGGLTLLSAK